MGERWLRHRVSEIEEGRFVRDVLTRALGLSRRLTRESFVRGGLRLNGAAPYLTTRVAAGDLLEVRLPAAPARLRPRPLALTVLHEDADLFVVEKPAGLLVHPSRRSHVLTLAHAVAHLDLERGGAGSVHPVHRLDRDTTGLVLFARHPLAHRLLDRQLRAGGVRRGYLAVVEGIPAGEEGRIDRPIAVHPDDRHLRAVAEGGRPARTRWRVLRRFARHALLELALETGRTHQIRVHCAAAGHPLVGDLAYGAAPGSFARPALHAHTLAFSHPLTDEPLSLSSPLPADLAGLVELLEAG